MTAAPASTNITAGVATNLTTAITLSTGTSASTSYTGTGAYSLSLSPSEPTITLGLSTNGFFLPTRPSSDTTTLSVATTASTPSNIYVVTITATGTNTPPNIPTNCTYTFSMGTPPQPTVIKVWSPGGINGNWSTVGNWSPTGAPGSSNDVQFSDVGLIGSSGTANNTVDTACTLDSLTYGQTNNYHTTLINPGLTLSVTGPKGLVAGTGTDPADFIQPVTTVTGTGAALVVSNASANVNVGQAHTTGGNAVSSAQATLDLSGLDRFTASVARLLVGGDLSIKGSCGVLNLARTNQIMLGGSTAPQINIGDNTQSGGTPTIPSVLRLGQTNAVFADSIAVGRGKTDASGSSMVFNSSFDSPVAVFRGTNGVASRVGLWSIGDAYGSRTYWTYGTCDFSLGRVDALVDTMYVGKGASVALGSGANNPGTGTLTFNAGTIDVNTLEVGYSVDATGTGTVNANGGSLAVNTKLELAHGVGSSGTLNASSAVVTANAGITVGGGGAAISLNNATLNVTNATATIGSDAFPVSALAVTDSAIMLPVRNGAPSAFASALTAGGTANPISISFVPVLSGVPAQFPVLAYTTPAGDLSTFRLGTMPTASQAYIAYISNNTANSTIDLVITAGPVVAPLIWKGQLSGNWDTSTANWQTNGVSTTYQQNYPIVRFDDTLTANSTVNLTTTLTPGSLTVSNSATDYTFMGTGKLSGSTGLTKTGTRTLTMAESGGDDLTGGVTINGGTLQVGSGGSSGTLPDGKVSVDSGAALVFNRSDALSVPSVISGLGAITQNGTGLLALNGSNSAFAGAITVAHGTLQAGNLAALGTAAATVMVNSTATLDVNGQKFNNSQLITVSGAGVGGNGAIVNNSTNSPNQILRNVTLAGNTTFGGYSDWDIHSSGNPAQDAALSTSGNAFKVTKVGTNSVTIFGAVVDGSLGDIDIQAGTMSFERLTTGLGNPANTITVFTNATLQFANASNVWSKVVVLKDGATFRAIQQTEFAGPVTLESGVGTIVANTAGAQFILDAPVGGAGGLTKNGAGGLTLTSVSTYAGPSLVSAGTLALINSGSIDSSTNITVSAGAALDLSALTPPTLTLTAGRGLKGSGTVVGNVTMANGSTLTVGGPGTNTLGTLTVTNNLVLQAGSTNLMEVAKSGSTPVNDQVVATNVTYGGTLTVIGAGGGFAAGDTFKLFSASAYSSSFGKINLPAGTTWDTSKLGVDGTIKVLSVVSPRISSVTWTNGNLQLGISGAGGNSYHVWASTNVAAAPVTTTWTPLVTNGMLDNITGLGTFLDTSTTNYTQRFYVITVP